MIEEVKNFFSVLNKLSVRWRKKRFMAYKYAVNNNFSRYWLAQSKYEHERPT